MSGDSLEIGSVADGVTIYKKPCEAYQRTDEIILVNEAPVGVEVCFAQLKCRYNVPKPYINDTGVFVLASQLGPGSTSNIDCCDINTAGPIAATSASGTCKIVWPTDPPTHQTIQLNPWPEAEQGKFYRYLGWRLTANTRIAAADGKLVNVIEAEPIRSDSLTDLR